MSIATWSLWHCATHWGRWTLAKRPVYRSRHFHEVFYPRPGTPSNVSMEDGINRGILATRFGADSALYSGEASAADCGERAGYRFWRDTVDSFLRNCEAETLLGSLSHRCAKFMPAFAREGREPPRVWDSFTWKLLGWSAPSTVDLHHFLQTCSTRPVAVGALDSRAMPCGPGLLSGRCAPSFGPGLRPASSPPYRNGACIR